MDDYHEAFCFILTETHSKKYKRFVREIKMFFKDFVSVKRQKIKRGASQTYDTPSFWLFFDKNFAFSLVFYEKMIMLHLNHFVLHM